MIQDDQPVTRKDLASELELTRKEFARALEPLATKQQVERLAIDQINLRENMATKDDLKVIQSDVRRLTQTVDSFISDIKTYARESVSIPAGLDKQGAQISNHEKRISALESKP